MNLEYICATYSVLFSNSSSTIRLMDGESLTTYKQPLKNDKDSNTLSEAEVLYLKSDGMIVSTITLEANHRAECVNVSPRFWPFLSDPLYLSLSAILPSLYC